MGLNITETTIAGVKVVDAMPFQDQRGAFARLFCARELASILKHRHIVQINQSLTHTVGAVRGFHYQKAPHAEMKLIRCLKGRVLDVALDLRMDSPTFLQWHALELSPSNCQMLVIPEGCAHGFQVLEADSEMLYLHTEYYVPDSEGGVLYCDPLLSFPWPLSALDLSQRDMNHPLLDNQFKGLLL